MRYTCGKVAASGAVAACGAVAASGAVAACGLVATSRAVTASGTVAACSLVAGIYCRCSCWFQASALIERLPACSAK